MKPVTLDFVRVFFDLFGLGEPPAGLSWWMLANPNYALERPQYAAWFSAVVDGCPVAVVGK